jgi:hypothetical protein
MLDFVKGDLQVVTAGKIVPMIDIILTTQNWSQYVESATFVNLDYNVEPPFITVVRQPEVKYGTNPSLQYTIPNRKQFYYASVPTWNGNEQGMDIYTIPQPVPVDINYSVKIVCNRMRELNQLNKVVLQKFSSRQAYTFIKGQYVPIIMNNIADESQMTMDARKYYIQSYDFTMLGYLIDEEEFQVKPAIARVSQVVEVDTSLIRKKRNKYPENPSEFLSNFLYVSGITSLSDIIDFTANMTFIGSTNVNNYEVFINGDFYGDNINKIQITTNDLLTINIIKTDNTQESRIEFNVDLYSSEPINSGRVSFANNVYTLGVLSGSTFNISTNLGFIKGNRIKISHDLNNFQYSEVVSYEPNTGVLVFSGASDVVKTGNGTFSNWNVY